MKRTTACLMLLILSFNGISQIRYEPGYFIDNQGQRTECLIKNVDWKNNPVNFSYKTSDKANQLKAGIDSVMEFGVTGTSKYIRATVDIDRSSEIITELSHVRHPVYNSEMLFLKVLAEGKADLFVYSDVNLVRYFYTIDSSDIKQLIYKTYLTPEFKAGINNDFRQQLWVNLKCPDISMNEIVNLGYLKNELTRLFERYNSCHSSEPNSINPKEKSDLFNLSVRSGIVFSTLTITNSLATFRDASFSNKPGFSFGVEAEFVLPFLRNKWSFFMEPGVMLLNAGKEMSNDRFEVDYNSLELPVGIRHYFFLNNKAKIYLDASLNLNMAVNSSINFDTGSKLLIESMESLVAGAGFNYKKRFIVELRYGFNRNIMVNYRYWNSEYRNFQVILGYTLF